MLYPEPGAKKNTSKSFSGMNWGQSAHNWALMVVQISDGWWDCIRKDLNTFNILDEDSAVYNARGDGTTASLSGDLCTAVVFD